MFVQQLQLAYHALGLSVPILYLTLRRVHVLIDVQTAVASLGGEKVPVLRQVLHPPDGGLLALMREHGIALTVGAQVEDINFAYLQGGLLSSVVATSLFI